MYTGNSLILGVGKSSAAQIDSFFESRGKLLAPSYAPNKKYEPPPANLGNLIIAASRLWPQSVNHDLLAAQCLKESAAWQSEYARHRFNPSGLGAINNQPDNAIRFPTPAAGLKATTAHLLTYVSGPGAWTEHDPRAAVTPTQNQGVVMRLGDLDGKWAVPGDGYGASIANIANALLEVTVDDMPEVADDPRFAWAPDVSEFGYPKGTHGRNGQSIDLAIVHITAGVDSDGWLRGNNGSSTHYLSDKSFRPRVQHVRESDAAWTAGNRDYNLRGLNYEFETLAGMPISEDQHRNAADTMRPRLIANNIPLQYIGRDNGPGTRGIIAHADVPDPDHPGRWGGAGNHTDPGKYWDWNLFLSFLREQEPTGPPALPPTQPDPWADSNPWGDQLWIPDPFVEHINAQNWMMTGYAVSEAFIEGDLIVQYFERCRLEYTGRTVQRGLVGWESMVARYPERRR